MLISIFIMALNEVQLASIAAIMIIYSSNMPAISMQEIMPYRSEDHYINRIPKGKSYPGKDQSFYTSRSVLRLGNVARGRIKIFDTCGLPVDKVHSDEISALGWSGSMRKHLNGAP
jgi:hypothetical protein